MNVVPFDTLKLARDLEAAGLAQPVAAGASAALADALTGADLATKSDLAALEVRLDAKFTAVDAKFAALDSKLTGNISALNAHLTASISGLDSKLELLRRDMTIKLGGMIFVATGVLLAAMRLMPHL